MPNPNPSAARAAKRKKKVASYGDLKALRGKLWEAIEAASDSLGSEDEGVRLKACHAMTQTATAYSRLIEATEFEARLRAVEKAQTGRKTSA